MHAARVGRIVRRVPVAVAGIDETDELANAVRRAFRGRRALETPPPDFLVDGAVLQLPPHGVHHQHRILRATMAAASRAATGIPRVAHRDPVSPAFTPRAYASMTARSSAGAPATTRRATLRKPKRRARMSCLSATAPNSSDNSPAASRRDRSIWKKRSCACAKPVANARSARERALMTGTPRASRSMVASAARPAADTVSVDARQAAMHGPPGAGEGQTCERRDADQGPSQPAQPTHWRELILWERAGWSARWCHR